MPNILFDKGDRPAVDEVLRACMKEKHPTGLAIHPMPAIAGPWPDGTVTYINVSEDSVRALKGANIPFRVQAVP